MRQRLATLTSIISEVIEMFTTFETFHKCKFGEVPVFEIGSQGYKELLSFDADRISEKLKSDLTRINKWV